MGHWTFVPLRKLWNPCKTHVSELFLLASRGLKYAYPNAYHQSLVTGCSWQVDRGEASILWCYLACHLDGKASALWQDKIFKEWNASDGIGSQAVRHWSGKGKGIWASCYSTFLKDYLDFALGTENRWSSIFTYPTDVLGHLQEDNLTETHVYRWKK